MKKFLAVFAAAAVVAAAGFAVVHNKMNDDNIETETTSGVSSEIYQGSYGGYSQASEESSEQSSEQTSDADAITADQHSFSAEIDSVSGMMLIVLPDENSSEYRSSDKIAFSLDGISVTDENGAAVGYEDINNYESVQVVYSGDVRETYPAQIDAKKIVLSGQKYFNVDFVIDGTVVKTLRVEKGESINASDMPNAGAYCKDGYHFEYWLDGEKSVSSVPNITGNVTLTAKISKD